jgi:hypothetical protein
MFPPGRITSHALASRTITAATVTSSLVRCPQSVTSIRYVVPGASLPGRRTYLNARYSNTGAKWGRFNNSSAPLLSNSALNQMFFNGNYRLLWDIWVPILDVLPDEEYMMVGNTGEKWSAALLESTLRVLNWMITHHLGGSDSTADMTQEYPFKYCASRSFRSDALAFLLYSAAMWSHLFAPIDSILLIISRVCSYGQGVCFHGQGV